MYYVYRIHSIGDAARNYTGFTGDLKKRIADHNAGRNKYTAPFKPWKLIFYAAFEDEQRARNFEKYLKSGSGAAFGNKRLW